MNFFRKRAAFIWLLPALVLGALFFTDPDPDLASTRLWLLRIVSISAAIAVAYWWEKGIFDYDEADRQELFRVARGSPQGAGLALVARAIFFAAILLAFAGNARGQDVRQVVPVRCMELQPTVQAALTKHWPTHPDRALIGALIEHESCISLTHSKCCNPASRLKTQREEGAGLGQITRAYRADGSLRFDALAEIRSRHPALADWSWENVYRRVDLQVAALVLQSRENFTFFMRFTEPSSALAFGDAGYNGGNGGVQSDRRACAMRDGCDPRKWFDHVERTCTKSRAALYGRRSACDINRHHVHDVIEVRADKYRRLS